MTGTNGRSNSASPDTDTDTADRFGPVDTSDVAWPQGDKPVLLIGWLIALPVPVMLILAPT